MKADHQIRFNALLWLLRRGLFYSTFKNVDYNSAITETSNHIRL